MSYSYETGHEYSAQREERTTTYEAVHTSSRQEYAYEERVSGGGGAVYGSSHRMVAEGGGGYKATASRYAAAGGEAVTTYASTSAKAAGGESSYYGGGREYRNVPMAEIVEPGKPRMYTGTAGLARRAREQRRVAGGTKATTRHVRGASKGPSAVGFQTDMVKTRIAKAGKSNQFFGRSSGSGPVMGGTGRNTGGSASMSIGRKRHIPAPWKSDSAQQADIVSAAKDTSRAVGANLTARESLSPRPAPAPTPVFVHGALSSDKAAVRSATARLNLSPRAMKPSQPRRLSSRGNTSRTGAETARAPVRPGSRGRMARPSPRTRTTTFAPTTASDSGCYVKDHCCEGCATNSDTKCVPCHALNPGISEERRRQLTLECLSAIPPAGDRRVELAGWRAGDGSGKPYSKAYQATVTLNPQGKGFEALSEHTRAYRKGGATAPPRRVIHEDAIKLNKGAKFDARSETALAFTDATTGVDVMRQIKPAGEARVRNHSWRPAEKPAPKYVHAIPSLQLGGHEQVGRSEATTAFKLPDRVERQPPVKYKEALVIDKAAKFECETETAGLFSAPDMTDYRLSMAPAGQPGARTQADGKVGLQQWRSSGAHTGAEMAALSLAPGKGTKIDGRTTHALAYQKVSAEPQPIVRREHGIHINPALRLEGVSETREQFLRVPKVSAKLIGSKAIPSCAELLADARV